MENIYANIDVGMCNTVATFTDISKPLFTFEIDTIGGRKSFKTQAKLIIEKYFQVSNVYDRFVITIDARGVGAELLDELIKYDSEKIQVIEKKYQDCDYHEGESVDELINHIKTKGNFKLSSMIVRILEIVKEQNESIKKYAKQESKRYTKEEIVELISYAEKITSVNNNLISIQEVADVLLNRMKDLSSNSQTID
jgi:DNA-directed RNA polymerase subunit F